nr:MAG: hypothetical protein [Caudoviricetes sp.]
MNIYTQTIPYFYIIRNKETGIMYAGSKWQEGCCPDTFMKEDGYKTSSLTINSIIKNFGLNIFDILRIDTYCDGLHVHNYETLFLQTNNCAASLQWYNNHNNDGNMAFGTEQFKLKSLEIYGTEHPSQSETIKDKIKNTNLEIYGCENVFQNSKIKEKSRASKLENYGNEKYVNIEKAKQTCFEKYGVDNILKRKVKCEFCGEIKNVNHIHQCKLNPNRNVWDRAKERHPKAKTFHIETPSKEIVSVTGNIENFCESNGFSWGRLKRGTVPDWKLLTPIKKI